MNIHITNDTTLFVTIYFINIVLYFITFSWIVLLEKNKCDCSINWKRDFIKYFLICMIPIVFLSFYFKIADYMKYALLLFEIIYISIVFMYVRDLMRKHCNCGNQEDMKNNQKRNYTLLDAFIVILTLILFLMWKR